MQREELRDRDLQLPGLNGDESRQTDGDLETRSQVSYIKDLLKPEQIKSGAPTKVHERRELRIV